MNKRIVRVTKEEFELDDGSIYPINPPLLEEISIAEFQEYYDRACYIIEGIKIARGDDQNLEELGRRGENKDRKNSRKT